MKRIALLGATGSLGSHVARLAVAAGHPLSVLVRSPARLAPEVAKASKVTVGDLQQCPRGDIAKFAEGHDVFINCAGTVTEGERFTGLVDRVVSELESLSPERRPKVCWFLAGAGVLEIDGAHRRGVDLPKVRNTYWPHRVNFERLQRSGIAWRLLCPGPMTEGGGIGAERLRVSVETLPAPLPAWTGHLPGALVLPLFAARIPEMIVTYADAAAFMLANTEPAGPYERKRVGLALPAGMKGKKEQWAARPRAT